MASGAQFPEILILISININPILITTQKNHIISLQPIRLNKVPNINNILWID